MREIKQIIVHCSDSAFGDRKQIDQWHVERGFAEIGYHFVVMNGIRKAKDEHKIDLDGKIETGRSLEKIGAHCAGENSDSIGICLVGKQLFSASQFQSLLTLIERMRERFGNIPVYGHYEKKSGKDQGKTCPNFDMNEFRTKWSLWA